MDFNFLNLSKTVLFGYLVSWLYFFITLPFFTAFLGKIKGSFINYLISWGIMIVVVGFLQSRNLDFLQGI